MKHIFLFVGALSLCLAAHGMAAEKLRLISLGGPVTETVYALGAGDRLVGTDTSSVYPEAAMKLPQVGYQRALAAEGVLALKPDLVLATNEAGPPAAMAQIRAAGVEIVLLPNEYSVAGAQAKVKAIAAALDRQAEGEKLAATIAGQAAEANALVAKAATKPKVLFLYARGGSTLNVSGHGTAADAMIGLAGAQNAVTGYEGYKPLTAESAVTAAPDYILMLDRGLSSVGGKESVLSQPGLALTPAGQNQRVVAFDDLLLLGFGLRTGQALTELSRALHPPDAPRP